MTLAFCLFLFIIGVILYYYRNGIFFFHYFFLWILLAPALLSILLDIGRDDYWEIMAWSSKLGDFALLDSFINYGRRHYRQLRGMLKCLMLAVAYVAFLIVLRSLPALQYFKYGLECFSIIAGISMFSSRRIDFNSLFKFLRIGFVFELFIGLIQTKVQSFNFNYASSGNEVLYVNGTFCGNNTYIEFLTCLGFLISYIEYKQKGKLSFISLLLSIILAYLVFESGVRMALIAFFIPLGFFLYEFYKKRKNKKSVVVYVLLAVLVALPIVKTAKSFISNSSVTYTRDATSAADRQAVIASIFIDNAYLLEHTTLGLSYSVITALPDNPVLGPGRFFSRGYNGYSYRDGSSITDATFALFIGEFGIVGLFIIGYMLSILLFRINGKNRGAIVMAIYLIFVSLTDNGIFGAINIFVLVSMIMLENHLVMKQGLFD